MALRKAVRYTIVGAAVAALLLIALVFAVTRTEFGVGQAGRVAVNQIRGSMEGDFRVDRFTSGGLFSGVTLHGVAIDDPDGRPFLRADSARLAYRFRTFLTGALVFDRLILHSPDVVIERLPGQDDWNYERIFPPDTVAPDTMESSLVLIEDIVASDGRVTVRLPWEPDGPVAPEDTARLILESVPGGTAQVYRFEEVNGRLPRIVWEAPGEDTRMVEVGELAARAYIWETPVEIEELEGVVTIRDSLISFDAPHVRLPDSRLSAVGRVILGDEENDYDIEIDATDVAFTDFQWLYPQLPEDGGGALQFRIQTQRPGSILWLAREARLRTSGTELAGDFGVVTGDTLYFTNVDLDASPLDLDLLRQIVPIDLPLEGLLIGTVEVEGPISSLQTRGDIRVRTFRDGEGAESLLRWDGTVQAQRPFAVRGLTADLRELDLEQVAQLAPGLRLRGTATGRVRANGSIEHGLDVVGDVALDRPEGRSAVRGSGRFAVDGDRSAFDLRFDADPVPLHLLVEQFPGLGRLAGEARGPVTVTGSLDELQVDADIMTPAGGVLVRGTFALTGPTPRYRAEGQVTEFELHRVARDLPETVMTGRFDIEGQGDRPETVDAHGTLDVLSARVAGVEMGRSRARGSVADGLIRLDSLVLTTEVGTVEAAGTFGIIEERQGEMRVSARAETLAPLELLLFPEPPSPEMGAPPEPRLAGVLDAHLSVTGSVGDWGISGRVGGRDIVYDRLRIGAAAADFDWSTEAATVDVFADSLRHGSRRLRYVQATAESTAEGGRLEGRAGGPGDQQLDVEAVFERAGEALEVRLRRLDLTTAEGRWALADTVRARVGRRGVHLDSLALVRAPRFARIEAAGALPWRRIGDTGSLPASMAVNMDSVRIRELLRVAQMDTTVDGVVQGRVRLDGTARAPVFTGRLTSRPFRYGGAVLDSAGVDVRYRDRSLALGFAGWESGASIVYGSGIIPVDLALTDRPERLLDEALAVRVRADRAPAGLVSFLAPGFRDVSGTLDGEMALGGTTRHPGVEGELRLTDGTARFEPLNVRYQTVNATARFGTGRVVEIDAQVGTGRGTGRLLGTVDLSNLRDPGLDLALTARELEASRRRDVVATATGEARVAGSYTRPVISGDLRIIDGELNLDEIWRQYQIVHLDPSFFQMFDSTAVGFRPEPENPFLENLVLADATITADRDFWLRSRELNVEVSGTLDLAVDRQVDDLRLTGTLEAMAGQYALQLARGVPARTFDIRGGTVEFLGTPGIDPDLAIDAGYRLRRAQGDPIEVVARVSGTLKDPRVGLSSDSDFPLTESDLASYILFGRSGAELTQAETDLLSNGIGLVRPVATGILADVAQGALAWTGVVDYVALTAPEYGFSELGSYWQSQGLAGMFHNTQVEIGIDAGRDLSLVLSGRIPTDGTAAADDNSLWRQFGARFEWRFQPTWTTELYVEDRFARTPSFGLAELDDRKVWGVSLFRDWGY